MICDAPLCNKGMFESEELNLNVSCNFARFVSECFGKRSNNIGFCPEKTENEKIRKKKNDEFY